MRVRAEGSSPESDAECSGLNFQTLGNGDFAFSADVTGLQTFNHSILVAHPGAGDEKILDSPVNTMSNWGWHITPVEKSTTPQAKAFVMPLPEFEEPSLPAD